MRDENQPQYYSAAVILFLLVPPGLRRKVCQIGVLFGCWCGPSVQQPINLGGISRSNHQPISGTHKHAHKYDDTHTSTSRVTNTTIYIYICIYVYVYIYIYIYTYAHARAHTHRDIHRHTDTHCLTHMRSVRVHVLGASRYINLVTPSCHMRDFFGCAGGGTSRR